MAFYKRNIFVTKPAFQYKFAVFVCFLALLTSVIYPWTIYDLYEKIILLNPSNSSSIEQNRQSLLLLLALIEFGILGVTFIVCIFISHKIAGPLYKLQNFLSAIRHGGPVSNLSFRKGDNFPEIAEEINQTIEYFVQQRHNDFAQLDEVSTYIANLALVVPEDKKPVLNEILSKLAQIQARYQSH